MIKFYRGLRSLYNQALHGAGIYFATDTLEIIHNNQSYSGLLAIDKSVKDITVSGGVMTITYTDNSTTAIPIGSGKYVSNISDKSITMTTPYGDFGVGTKVSDLEGKTYDELFDGILFPTITPTFVEPTATIKLKNYAQVQEVGSTAPTTSNFTVTYDAGAINLNGVKQDDRGGSQNLSNSFIYYGNINSTLPTTVAEGNTSYKYRAAYTQGPQPKDNKGNNYQTPLEEGFVDSVAVTVNGTYPWYATTTTAGTLTKQALVSWSELTMSTGEFELQPHTTVVPQQFKLPRQASTLEMYSTVSKSFETVALSDWEETTSSEKINGISRTYYTYSYKGANRGSVKLIVKF